VTSNTATNNQTPYDAHVLLAAAIACRNPAAAKPVIDWVAVTGLELEILKNL
jgi:hypothetical protein